MLVESWSLWYTVKYVCSSFFKLSSYLEHPINYVLGIFLRLLGKLWSWASEIFCSFEILMEDMDMSENKLVKFHLIGNL